MKSRIILILLIIIDLNSSIAQSVKNKEFKIPYEKYKISNGLNIVLHVDKSDPIVAVYIVYHVGSSRESKGKTGFAHLFEHLKFNESQDIPQGQWLKKLQAAGAIGINGSTNTDITNYYEVVPSNALEMALWMESDRMGFLLSKVNQESFVTQQNVVQNEKRQGDNYPYSQSQYTSAKLMYPPTHPYGHTTMGEMEDLSAASLQDIFDFHAKYYSPSNATLVIAGDINVVQTKKWIEKYFAEIKSTSTPLPLPKMPVMLKENIRSYCEDNLANAPYLKMEYPTVEQYNKDAYALEFFGRLFAESKKSPLYKVIVEEKKLAASVGFRQQSLEISGTSSIEITAFPLVELCDVETAIKEAFQRFEKESFTDKDLKREKAKMEYDFYEKSITDVLNKAICLGDYNVFCGTPGYMTTDLKNRMDVTKEDVWRVYNKYIKGKNYLLISIAPKSKADLAAPNSKLWVVQEESIENQGTKRKDIINTPYVPIPSKIDRTKEPLRGPDPVINIPKIWKAVTVNGIPIYGIKQSEVPLVKFAIIIKGGMFLDEQGLAGVSLLTARLMNEGTKTKTPVELREAIQDLGASISVNNGGESISITGTCLTSKLYETFALAKEMLFEPRWDIKEFELLKNETLTDLRSRENSPGMIASSVFNKLVYGADNILSNMSIGTIKSVEKITIDDLKRYYSQYFSSSACIISIVGDITHHKAVALCNELTGWSVKEIKIPDIKITSTTKPGIYFVDVPNAKQSVIVIGHSGPRNTDPEYYKATVINHRLGGDFSGILNMILREEKSFTYGAKSSFSGGSYAGQFNVSTAVQANSTFESLQIIRNEIEKYVNGISAEDLDRVKSTLLKSNAGRFEGLNGLFGMLWPVVMNHSPFDYIKRQEAIVRNMTLKEHNKLIQKFIHPDKLIYLIVGDKATQFDKLKELGLGEPVLLSSYGMPLSALK